MSQRLFPGDARLTTEITALRGKGFVVDLICMRGPRQPLVEHRDGVRIYRVPSLTRRRAGWLRYTAEYATFFALAFLLLNWLYVRKRHRLVHVTNLPDPLAFVAVLPKLFGATLVFDVRECTPEMLMDRFGAAPDSAAVRAMGIIEQAAIRLADGVVTCTDQMRRALIGRGGDPRKIAVVLNVGQWDFETSCPSSVRDRREGDTFTVITHGTITRRYGHDVLIRAMAKVVKEVETARLDIFGQGDLEPAMKDMVRSLGLESRVRFHGFVSESELLDHLLTSDCGVVSLYRTPASDLTHTYKMYEYVELGIPTIITRTSAVEAYFDSACFYYFESGDADGLADGIIDLARKPEKRRALAAHARRFSR